MSTIQKIGRYFIGVGMYVLIFQFKFIGTNQTGPQFWPLEWAVFELERPNLPFWKALAKSQNLGASVTL